MQKLPHPRGEFDRPNGVRERERERERARLYRMEGGGTVVTFVIRERHDLNSNRKDFFSNTTMEREPSIDNLIRKFESMNQDGTKLVASQNRPLFFDGLCTCARTPTTQHN